MSSSDIINVVAVAISGFAAIVSVVALVLSWRANRTADHNASTANTIQQELLHIEWLREA